MKTHSAQRADNLSRLFDRQPEDMFVNQIISGNVFMTAEDNRPIKIKDLGVLSSRDKLQSLIWNKNVRVTKLYMDDNNCIVSEVFLHDKPLKEYLAS